MVLKVGEYVEKLEPCTRLVGMLIGAATMENSMEVIKKLKLELPYYPSILFCVYIQKN